MAFILLASAGMTGCPLANGFFIRVVNNATDIGVAAIRLHDFNAESNVTGNLLRKEVDGGATLLVFVPLHEVGTADALRVRIEGTNPEQPIGFRVTRAIDGGFEAGKTVTVTVDGSPTQSVNIDVEPS